MFNIIHFKQIDSTNTYAKQNIQTLHHYDVIHTDQQTQGRGRKDHVWHTTANKNLTATLVIKDAIEPSNIHQLTQVTALSIIDLCQDLNIEAKIKWPNDIYIQDKKLAGILIETIFSKGLEGIVIGTGINIKEDHLLPTATSLYQWNTHISIEEVLHCYLHYFNHYYQLFKQGQYQTILEKANTYSYLKDKKVILPNFGEVKVGALLEDGRIELIDSNKTNYIYVNEFSLSK